MPHFGCETRFGLESETFAEFLVNDLVGMLFRLDTRIFDSLDFDIQSEFNANRGHHFGNLQHAEHIRDLIHDIILTGYTAWRRGA